MSMKKNALSISLALLLASGPGLVLAQTADGTSAAPPSLSNAVGAARAPGRPTGVTASNITATTVDLSWTASTGAVAHYRVYTSSSAYVDTPSNATTHRLTGLEPGKTYYVQVSALDADDGESGKSTRLPVQTLSDNQAPDAPGNVSATDITANSAKLNWTKPNDNIGVTGYHLLRNGIKQDEVGADALDYTFAGLAPETTYTLGVRARDAANNPSPVASVQVTTLGGEPGDTTPPMVPTGLASTGKTSNSIGLKWNASTDEGGSGVKEYIVSRDGTDLSPVGETTRTITGLSANTQYTFTVKARDNASNTSAASGEIKVKTEAGGGTPPTPPKDLTAVPDALTKDKAVLTWQPSTDEDGDLAFYDVYSNGNLVKSVAAGTHTATIEGLRQNATYEFLARARDAGGNVSIECTSPATSCYGVRSRMMPRVDWVENGPGPDNGRVFAPYYPTYLRIGALRHDSVKLEWDAAISDVAVAYDIYQDEEKIAEFEDGRLTHLVHLSPGNTYSFTVAARNLAANTLAAKSPPIWAHTPEEACVAAPAAPRGIQKAAGNSASITLKWSPAPPTGHCNESRYKIYRDDALVGEAPVAAFTDAGLEASHSYRYTVKEVNEFGEGVVSESASLSTGNATDDPAPRNVGYFEQWGVYGRQYFVKNILDSGAADVLTDIQYSFGNIQPKLDNGKITGYVCQAGIFLPTDEALGTGGDAPGDYAHVYTLGGTYPSIGSTADVAGQPLRGSWNQLKQLKALKPHLKVLISLGGWTWTRNFSEAARPEYREAFVASCIDTYIKGNLPVYAGESSEGGNAGGPGAAAGLFDGIDIDWEYPVNPGLWPDGRPEDRQNYTALLAEFRKQLDAAEAEVDRPLTLSVAVGAGIDKIRATEVDQYHQYLDWIGLMTYDFHGGWEANTNHQSAIFPANGDPSNGDVRRYNVDDAVQEFLNHGVPAGKLLVGIPYYGRGWKGVPAGDSNGLYQPAAGAIDKDNCDGDDQTPAPSCDTVDVPHQAGMTDYKVLARILQRSGWTKYNDSDAGAAWIYSPAEQKFWTYEGPDEVAAKVDYAKAHGLGGALIWALSGDAADGELTKALGEAWEAK